MGNSLHIPFPAKILQNQPRAEYQSSAAARSFVAYIFGRKTNRVWLILALTGPVMEFIIFKLLYPYPDFFSDSYSYIYAASANLDINLWPIGYSKFLAVFHVITHSGIALVAFQYFFLEFAALYFFFTSLYFFQPRQTICILLLLFLFFNPLFIYLSNYVSSDPLFAALSLWWFTELLWIIKQPRLYQLITQAILLLLCFTVRNNAYYYPLVTIVAFILSRQSVWLKIAGCLLGPALILLFVLHTRTVAKQITGKAQFSLFTGWQVANNALYFRDELMNGSILFPTKSESLIDTAAIDYFKKIRDHAQYRAYLTSYVGNYFIREDRTPLKSLFLEAFHPTNNYSYLKDWAVASYYYDRYGSFLIRHYPLQFLLYFVIPNIKNYFLPPLEKLSEYNAGQISIYPIGQKWFSLNDFHITAVSYNMQGWILFLYPSLFLAANLFFVYVLCSRLINRTGRHRWNLFQKERILFVTFIGLNFLFSISTAIIVFRYQVFPLIVILLYLSYSPTQKIRASKNN